MTAGVEENAKGRTRLHVGFAGAQGENLLLGRVEIIDVDVDVGLLWSFAARPHGGLMVGCELERERDTALAAQLHPIIVSALDLQARDRGVEHGQGTGVTAVERYDAQSSNGGHEAESCTLRSLTRLPKRGSLHG